MKFIAISDTHGKHEQVNLPDGDVLIHAGDITWQGHEREVLDFLGWFANLSFRYKIFIAGNHDFYFERESSEKVKAAIPGSVIYLEDSSIDIEGIRIWGSPVTPWFYDWAFNRHRGEEIRKHWEKISEHTDIVVTHGPAYGMLDQSSKGEHLGCKDLYERLAHVKPRIHVCGHIHEAYGTAEKADIKFINCSATDEKYRLIHAPVVFEL